MTNFKSKLGGGPLTQSHTKWKLINSDISTIRHSLKLHTTNTFQTAVVVVADTKLDMKTRFFFSDGFLKCKSVHSLKYHVMCPK